MEGIALMCAAQVVFAVMDATAKELAQRYAVTEIAWIRYVVPALLLAVVFWPRRGRGLLRTGRLRLQLIRALMGVLSTTLFYAAVHFLPLAEATAIAFLSPLIVTGVSALFLGERVDAGRWAAVAVGFGGVLLIVRPGGAYATWTIVFPIAMALCYALYQILTRKASSTEDSVTTLFYTQAAGVVILGFALPISWTTPSLPDLGFLVLLGVLGAVSHFLLIVAFGKAPASVIAPFDYTKLLWAVIFGFWLFSNLPDLFSVAGMATIVGSGLYVLRREQRMARGVPAHAIPADDAA